MRKNRSKPDKPSTSQIRRTGQTGQTGRTNGSKRAAKVDNSARSRGVAVEHNESLSAGEAARELGISARTLRRLCSTGEIPSFCTPGGQVRVWRNHLDGYRQGLAPRELRAASSPLENKREGFCDAVLHRLLHRPESTQLLVWVEPTTQLQLPAH